MDMQQRNQLYLIGAGDFGREIETWILTTPGIQHEWKIMGFLDKNPDALKSYPTDLEVLGDPEKYPIQKNDYFLICISDPEKKERVYRSLARKANPYSFFAPNMVLGKFNTFGDGVVVCPFSCISTNVQIGNNVCINLGSQIGHDCKIGSNSSLMANVHLGGNVILGEKVFVGTSATIIPKVSIADGVTIGAGSVVVKSIEEKGTYFGNPARKVSLK